MRGRVSVRIKTSGMEVMVSQFALANEFIRKGIHGFRFQTSLGIYEVVVPRGTVITEQWAPSAGGEYVLRIIAEVVVNGRAVRDAWYVGFSEAGNQIVVLSKRRKKLCCPAEVEKMWILP